MDDREDYEPPPIVRQPARRALLRATLAVCALAAVAESSLWVASQGGLQEWEVFRLALYCSPYLFLAVYAWLQRGRTAPSLVLLIAAVIMAALGLAAAGWQWYSALAAGATPRDSNAGLIACFQWVMVIIFGALSVLVRAIAGAGQDRFSPRPKRRARPEDEDE